MLEKNEEDKIIIFIFSQHNRHSTDKYNIVESETNA